MIKIIGKACISVTMAFLLSFAIWYFLLLKLPEDALVQGTAAPTMSKEEALDLMNHHGVKVIWAEDGEWFFHRDGKDCKLTKMEK